MNVPTPAIEPVAYRRLVAFKLLLLAILGAGVYLNSLYGDFLSGDRWPIAMSGKAWLCPTRTADFSLALNYAISRSNPWSYHLLNVFLQTLAALALYGIACRTMICLHDRPRLQDGASWLALLIALLWTAHPLNTETVDYLTRRGDLLAGLFYLTTLYCVIRGAGAEHKLLWYSLAVLACFLGMGSALTSATAPLVVLLYDRIYLADSWREVWMKRAGLYAGLVACWVLFGFSVFFVGYDTAEIGFGIPEMRPLAYALAQPGVMLHDLTLVFLPLGICFDYYDWPLNQPIGSNALPFIVVGALLAATAWSLTRYPKIGFLGVWFFLTLAPTSSLIPLADAAGDYRMYLPLAAVAVLVVLAGFALVQWVGERVPWTASVAAGLALLTVGALGYTTFRRNSAYENDLTIWVDTVARRPANVKAQFLLGGTYQALGEPDRQFFDSEFQNLYKAIQASGKSNEYLDKAAAAYQAVLKAPAENRNRQDLRDLVRDNLVHVLILTHRADELLQLVAGGPGDAAERARQLNDHGFDFWATQDPAGAARLFGAAVKLEPEAPNYHFNLALALQDNGDKAEAKTQRQIGLELAPDWPETAQKRAWKMATTAEKMEWESMQALFLARQASQDRDDRPEALDVLAAAYAAAGDFKEAAVNAEQGLQLAEAENKETFAHEIRQRLALYKEQKPFVQQQAKP